MSLAKTMDRMGLLVETKKNSVADNGNLILLGGHLAIESHIAILEMRAAGCGVETTARV